MTDDATANGNAGNGSAGNGSADGGDGGVAVKLGRKDFASSTKDLLVPALRRLFDPAPR